MFATFAKKGVTKDMIYSYFEVSGEDEITPEIVAELRTTWTTIKEGQMSAEELFIKPYNEKKATEKATAKAGSLKGRIQQAMAAQNDSEENGGDALILD